MSSLVVPLAAALVLVACQPVGFDSPTAPVVESATEFFEETVEVGGTTTFAVPIDQPEYASSTLIGIFGSDPKKPIEVPMGLRLGQPTADGTCSDLIVGTVMPGFAAQQARVLQPSTYCVEVFDVGNLTEAVTVLVRFVHPAAYLVPRPAVVTSGSIVTVSGSSSRSFEATAPGVATVTLVNLDPNVVTGLGVGLQRGDGSGCRLTHTITTTARSAPHFTFNVDPGGYCAEVFDVGNYTKPTAYTFTIAHP